MVPSGRDGSGQPLGPIFSGRVGPGQASRFRVISVKMLILKPNFSIFSKNKPISDLFNAVSVNFLTIGVVLSLKFLIF